MRRLSFPLIVLLCLVSLTITSLLTPGLARVESQGPDLSPTDAPAIHLRAATFVPAQGQQPGIAESLRAAEGAPSAIAGERVLLVQFDGPILEEWQAALEAAGATILDYIPDYAYKVSVDAAAAYKLAQLKGVLWVGAYQPGFRISPEALTAAADRQTLRVELAGEAGEELLARLPELGVRLMSREGRTLVVEADAAALSRLSGLAGVEWIAPFSIPRIQNDAARGEIRANQAWETGFTGQGQIVNVADTGLDTGNYNTLHSDIRNRVPHMNSWPISDLYYPYLNNPADNDGSADLDSGHGTHVAGSALGSGYNSNGLYRGVAPQAQLTFQALEQYCRFSEYGKGQGYSDGYWLVGVPANLNDLYAQAYNWGARVHSNSWGGGMGEAGSYDVWSKQTDQFIWEHRDMVVLFATGNEGRDANGDGRVDYGSALPPSTAKNIIAVGGTENLRPNLTPGPNYQTYYQFAPSNFPADPIRNDPMANAGGAGMMAFSGRGPALDGRIIPSVVAPGTWIASMQSTLAVHPSYWGIINTSYAYMGGTSMSTPLVAGGAALVRQAYMTRGHARPSAALIKATLIHTAADIPGQYAAPYGDAGPAPNNNEGWGLMNLEAAVSTPRFFVDEQVALRTGQQAVYHYQGGESNRPVRFTLVWTDYPAATEAGKQLVNDLDMEVIAPDGTIYRGNAFSNGWTTPTGSADRVNNVEGTYLPSTQPGTYTVRVRGYNVPMGGGQNFALLSSLPPVIVGHNHSVPLVMRNRTSGLPVPTPRPVQQFRDDFAQNNGVWPVRTTPQYQVGYLNGEYRMLVYPNQTAYALPTVNSSGWTNQTLEVDVRPTNGVSQAYGLLFNASGEGASLTYHIFILSPSGHYAIARQDGAVVKNWSASAAIHTGQASNRLKVRRVGQQVQFLINGIKVWETTDAALTGGTRFGLVTLAYESPHADVRFDNFSAVSDGAASGSAIPQTSQGELMAAQDGLGAALMPEPPKL